MIRIIHSDPRFYLINKSPGVGFHREADVPGVLDLLRRQLADTPVWPVHRLDRVTSGLLLVARSAAVAAELGEQFAAGTVEKYYLALSDRKPNKKQGMVKGDMAKGRGGAWKLLQSQANPAVTQFFSASVTPGLRLFVLRPRSGKTHQLRVAMKSLSAPILGDTLYGGSVADRAYLHAAMLKFRLGEEVFSFFCPPDQGEQFVTMEFTAALARTGDLSALPWPHWGGRMSAWVEE